MPGESLIGNLAILLSMDTAAFEKGAGQAQKVMARTQRQFADMGKKISSAGAVLSVGLTAPLAAFAVKGVQQAQETAHAMGQVEAALASMGPVAGKTAKQLSAAADAFEAKSLFEADEILTKVTANLLTFGNVAGQQFDQAQQAIIDFSARTGTDLQAATIMLGKALNDPIKGLTALSRAGVQFTDRQKAMIKSMVEVGNTAGAQGVILGEFQRQFSGAANAAQNTDPMNKATDAFNRLAETVGNALIPILPVLADAISTVVDWFTSLSPTTQKWLLIAAGAGAALGPLLIGIGGLVSTVGTLLPLILSITGGFLKFVPAIVAVGQALLVLALNPVGLTLLAIAAAVTAVYLAWKNWDKIVAIVQRVFAAVKLWMMDKLGAVWTWLKGKIDAVIGWFRGMYNAVVGNSYVPDMVDGIAAQMRRLDSEMVKPVADATSKTAQAFADLQQRVSGILSQLFPESVAKNEYLRQVNDLTEGMRQGIITADQLREALMRLNGGGSNEMLTLSNGDPATIGNWAGMGNALGQAVDALDQIPSLAQRANDGMADLGRTINRDVVFGILDAVRGFASWRDVAIKVLDDIINKLLTDFVNALNTSGAGGSVGGIGGAIVSLLGSAFGGPRAAGGPVKSGRFYMVGERGPELFAPGRSGRVISNDNLPSGGDTYNLEINVPIGMSPRDGRQTGAQIAAGFHARMAQAKRQGF